MNSDKTNLQKRKASLKPYVYPRCYDMTETFEKKFIKKIQIFNSNLRESRRRTMAEAFRDQEEQGQECTQQLKQNQINDENKTRISLYSRINRLKSFISYKSKPNSQTDRIFFEAEQTLFSKGLISSRNSQNSYQRLKKLYQTELKSSFQSAERSQNNLSKSRDKSKKRASLQLVKATNFHNCSINENQLQDNKGSEDFKDMNKSSRTNSFSRGNSAKKKQNSPILKNQTKKLNFSLFTKLQQLKQKKQIKDCHLWFLQIISIFDFDYFQQITLKIIIYQNKQKVIVYIFLKKNQKFLILGCQK
ncbi:unnamed protein product [Paramecium sonneborni]|uniref:Uncharacterized protein n=1 Tax=Paramecium sonneborni TaxID=65129 RepID=A0A8S1PDS4_9CILI|nr:unnamed protein product [Paramecium sonneborni]CAD8101362.1 unnamed protein product [Paramecium sonneborni]